MRSVALPILFVLACGADDHEETTAEAVRHADAPEGRMENGHYASEGSPDPLRCTTDDDCTHGGALGPDGCCWTYQDYNAIPLAEAYDTWQNAHRLQYCDALRCPEAPIPAEPPNCLFRVHCIEGACANECE